jgi:hypothetical protein
LIADETAATLFLASGMPVALGKAFMVPFASHKLFNGNDLTDPLFAFATVVAGGYAFAAF